MTDPIRVFSFGGGVQSTAALVLAAQGKIDYRTFAFANTGDDSENPATLAYVEQHSKPYAEAHGIHLELLQKRKRDGTPDTLLGMLMRRGRSVDIPVRMAGGAPGRRQCTKSFKIEVIGRYTKSLGATLDNPAQVGIGISMDEFHRMRSTSPIAWETRAYPLIDLRLSRQDCLDIIKQSGLPIPPKSSCWFCPMHRKADWQAMSRETPELFEQSVKLEDLLNERRHAIGRDDIFFSGTLKPLRLLRNADLPSEDDGLACDIGHCMT